ncbi:SRPBCC family protein [Sorangium sp. So ce260]|uniref:SRPBCC family protein n=1 Tax=Sorangium sp. So ce260 TaxID=3133291 RepID=UPI003F607349
MLYIQESIRIEAPIEVAWAWMSDLERLTQVNEFHVAMRFETEQRRGKGTRVLIDHSFFGSSPEARGARVTHWEEGAGIGWVETDLKEPRTGFPHSSQYRLKALPDGATLVSDELRGSLNLPFLGKIADRLLRDMFASRIVRRECAYLKEHIEEFAAGWKAGREAA